MGWVVGWSVKMRVWAQITLEMRRGPVMGVKSEKGRKKEEEGGEEQKRGGFGGWRLRCVGVGACVLRSVGGGVVVFV